MMEIISQIDVRERPGDHDPTGSRSGQGTPLRAEWGVQHREHLQCY